MEKRNIFNIEAETTRDEAFKRKAKIIGEIALGSAMLLMEDKKTHMFAIGVGLMQGLKYKGSLTNGIKGGLAGYGALIMANAIQNIVANRESIKDA